MGARAAARAAREIRESDLLVATAALNGRVMAAAAFLLQETNLPDLLLDSLALKDYAAAAVCSRWAEAWAEKTERVLRPVHDDEQPPYADLDGGFVDGICTFADGERLCVLPDRAMFVFDEQFTCLRDLEYERPDTKIFRGMSGMAGSKNGVYAATHTHGTAALVHVDMDTLAILAEYHPGGACQFGEIAVDPSSGLLLFAQVSHSERQWSEIAVFDTRTLQPIWYFGREEFGAAAFCDNHRRRCGLAVGFNEVYVGDPQQSCIRVFSFAGQHLREIRGEWLHACNLCVVDDRLYVLDACEGSEDERGRMPRGDRIYVHSLDGETLQVCPSGTADVGRDGPEPRDLCDPAGMCLFGGNLIAVSNFPVMETLVAFEGL